MQDKETFRFTYSAKDQAEIKRIREKYLSPEKCEEPLQQLRRLDDRVTQKATAVSIAAGVIGALLLGIGMCCSMVWTGWMIVGIPVGVIGIAVVAAAYPLYSRVLRKERERIAPEILRLTDELMK